MEEPAQTVLLDGEPNAPQVEDLASYGLRDFVAYFAKLGTFGFGGPIVLAGHVQRDLVEGRRWISEQDYEEGQALAQPAPGPLAAQLAIYIGCVRGRIFGAAIVPFLHAGVVERYQWLSDRQFLDAVGSR